MERRVVGVLGGLRIEVVREFTEIEAAWRRASEQSSSYVFQCYDWLALWNDTVGVREGIEPLLVRVSAPSGRTVLLLPLGMRRRYGCRVVAFLGGSASDYNAPLIDSTFAAACAPEEAARLWHAILKLLPRPDLVWLVRMPQTIEGVPNPLVTFRQAVRTGTAFAASPLPQTFKAFTQTRKSNVFRDAARKRRKVEALGPVNFQVVEAPDEIRATVNVALAQKLRRHSETGQLGLGPLYESFYKRLATSHLDSGCMHVSRLCVGDTVVATHLGAVRGSRFYWLLPGYEGGEWARYSVGRLLQAEIVTWCIEQRLETFDMTGGDEEYKRFWADSQLPLYACKYGLTWKGKLVMACVSAFSLAKECAKENPRVRAFFRSLKGRVYDVRRNRSAARRYGVDA